MTCRSSGASSTACLGPSGCGKTTTLRMIAGFEQPTAGEILLAGQPIAGVPPYQRNVNTVFQHYALFPHMDVAQNVGYGLRQMKVGKAEEARRVGEALALVRLDGYEKRRTWEMSGGQQQRVALARALVNHPTVLLLDEPLGALDLKLRKEMQLELKALQREVGITFVYVTHDQEEALTMSDVIVVMRDGRIQQQGRRASSTSGRSTASWPDFIGSSNFLEATLSASTPPPARTTVETAHGAAPAAASSPTPTRARRPAPGRHRRHPARAPAGRAGRGAAHGGSPGWTSVPRPRRPGHLSRRPDGVPGRHRPGPASCRPPPDRLGPGAPAAFGPGRSGDRPLARGRRPRPRRPETIGTGQAGDAGTAGTEEVDHGRTGPRPDHARGWRRRRVSRRGFLAASGLTGGGAFLAACARHSSAPRRRPPRRLHPRLHRLRHRWRRPRRATGADRAAPATTEGAFYLYNWADYTDEDNIETFKTNYGITDWSIRHLRLERRDDHQAAGRQRSASTTSSAPTADLIPALLAGDFIQKIDWSKVPNAAVHQPGIPQAWWDPTDEYSLAKDWGTTGITVRTKLVERAGDHLEAVLRPGPSKYSGRIIAVNSQGDIFAGAAQGPRLFREHGGHRGARGDAHSCSSAGRPHLLALNSDTYEVPLGNEEAVLGLTWTGGASDLRKAPETADTQYIIPDDGTLYWVDTWVMLAGRAASRSPPTPGSTSSMTRRSTRSRP